MQGDFWFKFIPSQWMGLTAYMTMEERGAYMTLICHQFMSGRIPDKTIRLLVGFSLVSTNQSLFDQIKHLFVQDDQGNWYNKDLEDHRLNRMELIEKRKVVGKLGGRPKTNSETKQESKSKPIGKPNAKANQNQTNSNSISNFNFIEGGMGEPLWPGYDRIREAWPKRDGLSDLAHHQVFRIWMNHANQIDPENGDHLLATYCEAYLRLAISAATEPHLVKSLKNYLNDHTYADHLEHIKMAERHESRVVTANGKMPVGFNQAFWDGTITDPKKRGDYAKHLKESGYEYITDANDRVTSWRKKA